LDVTATDKGFLMPRIALTGTDDTTTITPSATTGLMIFNTSTVATGSAKVSWFLLLGWKLLETTSKRRV